MSYDLTASISSAASISSSEVQRQGLREKLSALKQKATVTTGEPTEAEFATDSFGAQLSDLDGRRRWLLDGTAKHKWEKEPDLQGRVREILRANQGEIHKGRNIQRTPTVTHCWMLGSDIAHAQPTVVVSCNHSTVLKRTMRIIGQFGVLKKEKFVLKGIPFCDLKYRMEAQEAIGYQQEVTTDEDGLNSYNSDDQSKPDTAPEPDSGDVDTRWQTTHTNQFQDGSNGERSQSGRESYTLRPKAAERESSQIMPKRIPSEAQKRDPQPLLFGAEEIAAPDTGRLATLGGFIMVDDVCFGLTAAHTFLEESSDDGFGQQSITEDDRRPHLVDMDWAQDTDSEDSDECNESGLLQHNTNEHALQRANANPLVAGRKYESESGELRRITASSQTVSVNGLDWALCDLGDRGKYAINGVYLPPALRTDQLRERLLFNKIKPTPPLGKIYVATRDGVIPGHGTGSGTSIKLGRDDNYHNVWSIHLEQSLSSGDSGSWVVDAANGDVYGMIVAGSSALHEEYIIPAAEIGQEIQQVMRAEVVRLPTWQDVPRSYWRNGDLHSDNEAIGWDSNEDIDENDFNDEEDRFILAEVLKNSSIDNKSLVKIIEDANIRPKWSKIGFPEGRTLRQSQKALDRLLAGRSSRKKIRETHERMRLEQISSQHTSRETSLSRGEKIIAEDSALQNKDGDTAPLFEEPPELLDSNPYFRAHKSRRAWRAKRQADRGPKPHHRKHRTRKSNEAADPDVVLHPSGSPGAQRTSHVSKFEMDSEDEQGNLEPDIILVKHKGSIYSSKFPAFSIGEGSLLVGHLRQQVARDFGIDDASRVTLLYNGRWLKVDSQTCHDEGLKMRSEVLCVVKRTPSEELEFLANRFHAELVPQGLEFIHNTPTDISKRDFEYKKISETVLAQILLKLDTIETQGNQNIRTKRKEFVTEVQGFLKNLDSVTNKDSPSDWHADFLPQKQLRTP